MVLPFLNIERNPAWHSHSFLQLTQVLFDHTIILTVKASKLDEPTDYKKVREFFPLYESIYLNKVGY